MTTKDLTHAQRTRQHHGIPWQGPQPSVMFTEYVTTNNGIRQHHPEHSEFFLLDTGTAPSRDELMGVCIVHIFDVLTKRPGMKAAIYTFTPLEKDNSGGGLELPFTKDVEFAHRNYFFTRHTTPGIIKLAETLRGNRTYEDATAAFFTAQKFCSGAEMLTAAGTLSRRFRPQRDDHAFSLTSL